MSSQGNLSRFSMIDQLLELSPDAIIAVAADCTILRVNALACALLRSRESDLVASPAASIVRHPFKDEFNDLIVHRLQGADGVDDRTPYVLEIIGGDGVSFSAEITTSTVQDQQESLLVIAIRDISQHKLLETELRTNQILLAEAQKVADMGSWRWDIPSGTFTWSRQLFRLFGVPSTEELISENDFFHLIHPSDRDRIRQIMGNAIASQRSFEAEYRIIRPDGTARLIYGQGAPGLVDSGELLSMIGTAQDVTERKASEAQAFQLALEQAARQEAERTREHFQFLAEVSETLASSLEYEATLDQLMNLIIPRLADWCSINTLEPSGEINRLAIAHRDPEKQAVMESIRQRGFLPHDDLSHPLTRALHEGKPALYPVITDDMLKRLTRSDEHLELVQQFRPTSMMVVPLQARGRAFGAVTFGMSDSGRRYRNDDLQLATEVAHRASVSIDNAHLYQEANEAALAREEFVSLVSHELKTPLTVIKGYIQVLERYLERPEWERDRIRTTRERLSTQVHRLELLVADILDVSRIQRGRLDLNVVSNTDIVELARHVVERFDDAIERQPGHVIQVKSEPSITGCWDPLRLDQVFSNLLSNALKYSPDGGPIDVSLKTNGDHVVVSVTDSGVGIPHEDQAGLFQPFQRGAAMSRGISGTGLGLYITRQIIEQHGGTISVESEPGEYSTFRFELPLHSDDCPETPEDNS